MGIEVALVAQRIAGPLIFATGGVWVIVERMDGVESSRPISRAAPVRYDFNSDSDLRPRYGRDQ
jgi:hypothetical protein